MWSRGLHMARSRYTTKLSRHPVEYKVGVWALEGPCGGESRRRPSVAFAVHNHLRFTYSICITLASLPPVGVPVI
jgi:hypothetical protein